MSNLGISVNYNVPDTVDKMMIEQQQYMRLHRMQATYQAEQLQTTAYGALQTLFTNFQTQLTNVSDAFATIAFQAASSNTSIVSNTIVENNSIGLGNHTVVVTGLAQAQQYMSQNSFSSSTNTLNLNETLTFTNANNSLENFSIGIGSTDSLQSICNNINLASDNIGVSAAIISSTGTGGSTVYSLVLTAESGTVNQFNITGDTGNFFNFNQTVPGLDAQFTFDNLNQVQSSNVIDDVLNGLSFTIAGTGTATISVTPNDVNIQDTVQTAIQDMISAYNQIITFLDANVTVGYYDKVNKVSATESNNSVFSLIKMQLQQAVNKTVSSSGDINTLSDLGVILASTQSVNPQYNSIPNPIGTPNVVWSYGSLTIDPTVQSQYGGDTTLQWVLNNDFQALQNFFLNPTSGFIANVNDLIDNSIAPEDNAGIIWNATNSVSQQETYTNTQIQQESNRLTDVRTNLIEQYTKLNVTIAMYQGMSDYLEKQYEFLGSQLNKRSHK